MAASQVSAEPAAAGMFLCDLLFGLKTLKLQECWLPGLGWLSPSLVKQDVGRLGADILLVALGHVAVVVVVPVVVDLALPVCCV